MINNRSSEQSNNMKPKKFDPFDVVFCCHCDKLHHVESYNYIQLAGYIFRGLTIDLMTEPDDTDEVDELGDVGVRSYLSYIKHNEAGDDTLVGIFCAGSKDEAGCLEKYLQQCWMTNV